MDKIICVGKNYLDHARELGDAVPERPVLFLKPPSVLRQATEWGAELPALAVEGRGELHHELEIVLRLADGGGDLDPAAAWAKVDAVTLGLDMTLRDVQAEAKKKGHPWERAKVFRDAALLGPWIPLRDFPHFLGEEFTLHVDGQLRQRGRGREMRFAPPALLADASRCFPLAAGDAVFTGTPAGVGPVRAGQMAELRWGSRAFRVRWQGGTNA